MPWQGRQLPPGWAKLRRQRFDLDGWRCIDCGHHDPTGRTLECDHIGHRDDHRLDMLRTRCRQCHLQRTLAQATAARQHQRRPPERHPGAL